MMKRYIVNGILRHAVRTCGIFHGYGEILSLLPFVCSSDSSSTLNRLKKIPYPGIMNLGPNF